MKKLVTLLFAVLFGLPTFGQTTYTGIFRSASPYSNYHQFTRNGGGAATYINQMNTNYSILRLSGGSGSANANVLFSFEANGNFGIGTMTPSSKLHVYNGSILGHNSNGAFLKIKRRIGHASIQGSFDGESGYDGHVIIEAGRTSDAIFLNNYISSNVYLVNGGGRVGVGTTSPSGKLEINAGSDYPIRTSTTQRYVIEVKNSNDPEGGWWLSNDSNGNFAVHENQQGDRLTIQDGGNVGIGTTTPDAKLTVKGDIHAERVKVDLNIPAPDYVFEADYELRSLEETASYIQENKHLPEVPSAKELEASGIDLVEMNMLLLKKIEELTLHVIDIKKENDNQQQRIEFLENNEQSRQ